MKRCSRRCLKDMVYLLERYAGTFKTLTDR